MKSADANAAVHSWAGRGYQGLALIRASARSETHPWQPPTRATFLRLPPGTPPGTSERQITWSPNDVLTTNGSVRDLDSRAAAIVANENVTRDSIEVEVTQMLQAVHEADFSIDSSTREAGERPGGVPCAGASSSNNGRGTSTTLADAESDLTRARLDLLNRQGGARDRADSAGARRFSGADAHPMQ